ncbi:hypothetical protein AB6D30_18280 [Pectobacterium brasiliense]|uniref:hypothetical protein n=1 Tax=Pectobacterium brasiliense TaxID=180957 RepID=UPI0019699E39|nr:hypothetical protein [Pectobacterium brasiliense]MBN3125246.1 hypothetical protein [Pectobacterium brasiliense]MBN3160909.1 hypothetical protein [Pectobacterium brasiliense]MDY4335608.1 hypothetical protein [Pectobacterium brasiliense]QSD22890.1 hypothetical protein H5A38_00495 [Pectobacterium brasiliense]
MNIYTLEADIDIFKYYLPSEGSEIIKNMNLYDGRSLVDEWELYNFDIFQGKTKKEKEKREDFNISHYHARLLLISEELKDKIEDFLFGKAEFLPIRTSNNRRFFFMNVLNVKKSIDAESWDAYEEMEDNSRYEFLKIHDDELVFRDYLYNLNYFFTERFSKYLEEVGIDGCFFKKVGVSD